MRLARMTTRRWMVAVAVVGVALCVFHLWRLSREYQRRADLYAGHFIWEGDGGVELEALQRMSRAQWDAYILGRYEEILRWRAQMEAKYRRAARYPWLSVEPDPPEPR
jgi:hypothetical protein